MCLDAAKRCLPAERGGRTHTELGRAEPARRSFFQTREGAGPTKSTPIREPMQRRSVVGRTARSGCEHVHLVARAEPALHFTLDEVTRGVPAFSWVRSGDDGDAFAQVRGSSPRAFTASAP